MNRVLRPFFRFIRSFDQLSHSKLDNCSEAFKRCYLTYEYTLKGVYKNIPDTPLWDVTAATIFSTMDRYFSPMDDLLGTTFSKFEKRLLDHQMTLQNSFSYLEARLNLFSAESISLSILGQEKYPPREVPKSHRKDIWVNKFYNLHLGEYRLQFSWAANGNQKEFSYAVALSAAAPSQTLLFSLNETETQVNIFKVETTISAEEKTGKKKTKKEKSETTTLIQTIDL